LPRYVNTMVKGYLPSSDQSAEQDQVPICHADFIAYNWMERLEFAIDDLIQNAKSKHINDVFEEAFVYNALSKFYSSGKLTKRQRDTVRGILERVSLDDSDASSESEMDAAGSALKLQAMIRYALAHLDEESSVYHLYAPHFPADTPLKCALERMSRFKLPNVDGLSTLALNLVYAETLQLGATLAERMGDRGASDWYKANVSKQFNFGSLNVESMEENVKFLEVILESSLVSPFVEEIRDLMAGLERDLLLNSCRIDLLSSHSLLATWHTRGVAANPIAAEMVSKTRGDSFALSDESVLPSSKRAIYHLSNATDSFCISLESETESSVDSGIDSGCEGEGDNKTSKRRRHYFNPDLSYSIASLTSAYLEL